VVKQEFQCFAELLMILDDRNLDRLALIWSTFVDSVCYASPPFPGDMTNSAG